VNVTSTSAPTIAAFPGDGVVLAKVILHARERLAGQVAADGPLPSDLSRPRPRRFVMFTLQGWTTLTRVLSSVS
jgi:hypothetical protein